MRVSRVLAARVAAAGLLTMAGAVGRPAGAVASDQWIEVKSAHFTVTSNAGERQTRTLVWQLEQVRSATKMLWTWGKLDLNKPMAVVVVKDENSMRALAPQFWEERRSVRPASVWVSGPDQHYLLLRADVEIDSQATVNPYFSSYASYVSLMLGESFGHLLPAWLSMGLAGVLGNTQVRDAEILVGAPVPFYLQTAREQPLLPLAKVLAARRDSAEVTRADRRELFDAETWALVHFLMFGEQGKRADQLNAYTKMIMTGSDPVVAFTEAFGPIDPLESAFRLYLQRPIFSYGKFMVDASVEREKFPSRPLTQGDAAAVRALVLASMRRPVEARTALAEARTSGAEAASYVVEGIVLDQERKTDEARGAFAKAAELGSTSAYGYYRLAGLTWQPGASREVLQQIDGHLTSAVRLNTRYAEAYSWLGEIRAALGREDGIGMVRRAITLEPREARHRLRAARVLLMQKRTDEARVEAQAAMALADGEEERRDAQQLMDMVTRAGGASR